MFDYEVSDTPGAFNTPLVALELELSRSPWAARGVADEIVLRAATGASEKTFEHRSPTGTDAVFRVSLVGDTWYVTGGARCGF